MNKQKERYTEQHKVSGLTHRQTGQVMTGKQKDRQTDP
jgi:hypothetical protein